MGSIVISTNMSLDGVVEDPDGAEGGRAGNWFRDFGGADLAEWAKAGLEESLAAEALLLGRRSDAWFAERWLDRDDPWAERLNAMPKYVVSQSGEAPRWGHAIPLKGNAVEAARRLRTELDGEILVYASYQLARTLLEAGAVDEVRLTVLPVVLGDGGRLFGQTSGPRRFRLTGSKAFGENLTHLTYRAVRS